MGKIDYSIIGKKVNMLTVVGFGKKIRYPSGTQTYWKCLCECGKETLVQRQALISGHAKSCGCEWRTKNQTLDRTGQKCGTWRAMALDSYTALNDAKWRYECFRCGKKRVTRPRLMTPMCECVSDEMWALMYCMHRDGETLRDIGAMVGYSSPYVSNQFTHRFPEYKAASVERRANSANRRSQQYRHQQSRLFYLEKDFQNFCAQALMDAGKAVWQYERVNGCEIDIMTRQSVIELKVVTRRVDVYRAIGQVEIAASRGGVVPVICTPSDTIIAPGLRDHIKGKGIGVCDELTIVRF